MPQYYVYIVLCSDDTLYIGSTNNIEKRMIQHNSDKAGAKYTSGRRPVLLQYSRQVATYSEARTLEAAWKRLTRTQKLELIDNNL
jgi:putative endonuclease